MHAPGFGPVSSCGGRQRPTGLDRQGIGGPPPKMCASVSSAASVALCHAEMHVRAAAAAGTCIDVLAPLRSGTTALHSWTWSAGARC
jgi:hypothetical protein